MKLVIAMDEYDPPDEDDGQDEPSEHDERIFAIAEPVLTRARHEAMRSAPIFDATPRNIDTSIVDLIVAIVLEPDILCHLIDCRDLVVNLQALRRRRNPETYAVSDEARRRLAAGEVVRETINLVEGPERTYGETKGFEAAIEGTSTWAREQTDTRMFARWESRSFQHMPGEKAFDPTGLFAPAAGDNDSEVLAQLASLGINEHEAREMMTSMLAGPKPDDAWWQKLGARNFRYAILRDLFERAHQAEPQNVEDALTMIGISVLDMHATFDSLAGSFGWPDL
ncbi:MAG: hypothetical protein HY873_10855 [Chloroflexi bacterium]|nr:hypothetical protein [Chloroflexota bacterium]